MNRATPRSSCSTGWRAGCTRRPKPRRKPWPRAWASSTGPWRSPTCSPMAGLMWSWAIRPFMGGLKISGNFGPRYRNWLETVLTPHGGTADLCAALYRRVFALLRPGGRLAWYCGNKHHWPGGHPRERSSGHSPGGRHDHLRPPLHQMARCGQRGGQSRRHLHASHSPLAARSSLTLDGQPVGFISSRLDAEPEGEPKRLPQNEGKAFIGDYVRGIGFALDPAEGDALLAKDPRNADCLFPYSNGEDLNNHPEQQPSRWVICFLDWDLKRARQYPDLLRIVEERGSPEREGLRGPGDAATGGSGGSSVPTARACATPSCTCGGCWCAAG